jgi:hypothetical protein
MANKEWDRNERIALLSLVFGALACLAAIIVVPEIRKMFNLDSPQSNSNNSNETNKQGQYTDYLRTPWLGIEFWQGGTQNKMRKIDLHKTKVLMQREPFEMRIPQLKNNPAVEICSWNDDSIFREIKNGQKIDLASEPDSYFGEGKGMADTSYGSSTLMLRDDAHGYYDDERLKPISEKQSTIFVSTIWMMRREWSITKQKENLYLVIYRDLDQDKVIDNGEYELIVLDFSYQPQ